MIATIDLENIYGSGVYSKRPVVIVRGSGASLWDAEGREYIDCTAGYGVANIGHGRPEIAAAIAAQAQRLITCPEIVYNDVRARLLERLAGLTPEGLSHIFLCNSGTEAVEGALKFARLATGRPGIVAALRSFHGRTMGALSTTWEPHYREPFAPLIPGVTHLRYNDLAAAEAAINEQTAAVIIELVQGEGGVHVASEEYVQGLARLCGERGALLIVDEVQTGFGRTGRLFACNHYDLRPDILCLAKSLAGGIPIGAVCLGPRVIESGRITKGIHGSSFGGNPLACASALATLDILEREALAERAATLGARALERLRAWHTPLIREVRGRGLLLGIELSRRVQPYLEALLEQGVLALQAGPNVIRLLPPLVITDEQLEHVLDVLEELLVRQATANPVSANPTTSTLAGRSNVVESPSFRGTAGDHKGPPNHPSPPSFTRGGFFQKGAAGAVRVSGGDAPFLAPSGALSIAPHPSDSLSIADGEGWGEAASLLVRPKNLPLSTPPSPLRVGDVPRMDGAPEVTLLHNMLTIPSNSRQESALAHYLVEQAQQMGLHARIDDTGNLVASTHPAECDVSLRPIILLGHMDTVRGVIPVRLQDGVLYGRGAVDAKGPLAAFLCAAARLASLEPSGFFAHPIVVIGAVEEEAATSRGAHAIVEHYQPLACIIGEPSGSQAVTIGYKGRLLVEYCLKRPMSHSAGPQQSAGEVAVAFWNRIRDHAASWNRQYAANSTFAALTPSLRSINNSQDGLEERAQLCTSYRLPPGYDTTDLRTQLEHWAYEDGAHLSFSGEEAAFQGTRTTPLARAFIAAIRATGGHPSFKRKTGTSDMNVVGPAWGPNIVAYGPGDARLDHTPQEHIHIAEYIHAINVLELVLRELALQGGTTS